MNEIRIPVAFVCQDGAFGWLLDDAARAMMKTSVESGFLTQDADDEMEAQDAALRRLPGAFAGDLVFRRELERAEETILWSAAMSDASEALVREAERAKASGRKPLGGDPDGIAAGIAFHLRAEMLFERVEGDGSERFDGWESLPEQVRQAAPAMLQRKTAEQQRTVDDLLKKTLAASPRRKAR